MGPANDRCAIRYGYQDQLSDTSGRVTNEFMGGVTGGTKYAYDPRTGRKTVERSLRQGPRLREFRTTYAYTDAGRLASATTSTIVTAYTYGRLRLRREGAPVLLPRPAGSRGPR
jgi:hypothetical protein